MEALIILLITAGVALYGLFISLFVFYVWVLAFLIIAASIVGLVFWIIMLMDLLNRQPDAFPGDDPNAKSNWTLIMAATIVCGASWLGALLYYLNVKKLDTPITKQ